MIDCLDPDNAMGDVGMTARHMRGHFRFGAGRTRDQDRLCIGDCLRDLLEELLVQGRATADRVGLVVDVSRWIVWMEDHVIDLGRVEIEDLCFSVINPDNRVIMAGHGVCSRSHLEATAGRRSLQFLLRVAKSTFDLWSIRKIAGRLGNYSEERDAARTRPTPSTS